MKQPKDNCIYIVGAGFAGRALGEEIRRKNILGTLLGYLDDDPEKWGVPIQDTPVYGPVNSILSLQKDRPADEAIIAIPTGNPQDLRRIYGLLSQAGIPNIRLLPSVSQIIDGDAHLIQTRRISPEDLLPRSKVTIPLKESLAYLRGRRVLITGGGGSIGGELSRQLLYGGAQRLYLFDNGENNIYEIERELKLLQEEGVGEKATIIPILGDLRDRDYTAFILGRLKADVIFHCAAYKHVPMLEENPVEALKNNVFGTRNIADAAAAAGASRFVLISTDKAVEPSCVYGASKSLAEEIILSSPGGETAFMVVRFGNVLGSRGSIVPLFQRQILKGGPVTVTHPEMTRFFMTIPEASSLVLKAGGVGEGRNLYILDMGAPLNITDLAKQMIRFYGFEPERDIPIHYTGIRPGEKLTEALWGRGEEPRSTDYTGISRLKRHPRFDGGMEEVLEELRGICYLLPGREKEYRNRQRVREVLGRFIPTLEVPEDEPPY